MGNKLEIEEMKVVDEYIERLSELLIRVVDDGASIGFLPPMRKDEARKY
jgi:hypothetical protein